MFFKRNVHIDFIVVVFSDSGKSAKRFMTFCSRTADGPLFCAKVSRGIKKGSMVMASDNRFAIPRDHETPNRGSEEYKQGPHITLHCLSESGDDAE